MRAAYVLKTKAIETLNETTSRVLRHRHIPGGVVHLAAETSELSRVSYPRVVIAKRSRLHVGLAQQFALLIAETGAAPCVAHVRMMGHWREHLRQRCSLRSWQQFATLTIICPWRTSGEHVATLRVHLVFTSYYQMMGPDVLIL